MKSSDQNHSNIQPLNQTPPQHQTKKVIIIENHQSLPKKTAPFQENRIKLNQAVEQIDSCPVKDAFNQFIQQNKNETVNITQMLAEQSKFNPFNQNYIKEMQQMVSNNQKKLENLRGSISDLKKRAIVMEIRMDVVEGTIKQTQKEQRKKKNRRTAAEIQKAYNCPYHSCERQYGSEVSLNLHIKIKHNDGSRVEQDHLNDDVMINIISQREKLDKDQFQ